MFGRFGGDERLTIVFLCPLRVPSKYIRTQRDKESSSVLLYWESLGKVLELFMETLCLLEMPRQHLPQLLFSIVPAEECKVALLRLKDPASRAHD